MKVTLLVSRTGPDGAQNVGDEIDVPKEQAKRMMESNPPQCIPVRASKAKTEKAAKK